MNKKQKELVKIFIFLFALLFVVVNWDTVSWVFNYREVGGLAYDFFNPYQDSPLLVSASDNSNYINALAAANKNTAPVAVGKTYPYSSKDDSLEIPSIGLVTSLVIGQSTDVSVLEQDLDKGVVYYPGSVLPGQSGNMVVLGHSAPPGWPHIKHDWVFSDISNLNPGDQIIMYFNHRQYTYTVKQKSIIKKGDEISLDGLNPKDNILTIVSCWPPGKNYQRIAVQAVLE
jgi:LPXTG-site transpeptidase (sortase) family protein